MAEANIPITADTSRAQSSIRQLTQAILGLKQQGEATNRALAQQTAVLQRLTGVQQTTNRSLDRGADSFRRASREASGLGNSVRELSFAFRALIGAVAVRELVALADTYANMQARLRQVTKSTEEFNQASAQLFSIAQSTRQGLEETTDLYANLARSTEDLNVSQGQLLQVTETIGQAFIVSSTSAQSAASTIRQLGQAFASGTLRGDELNSIMENAPRLATAIAKGMGITRGELRKLGSEGKLTGAAVMNALLSQKSVIENEFANMPLTVGQSLTQVKNEFLKSVGEMDQALGLSAGVAKTISDAAKNIDGIANAAGLAAAVVGGALVGSFVASRVSAVAASSSFAVMSRAVQMIGVRATVSAVSMRALSAAMGLLGGPVGIAITAASIGLAVFAERSIKARIESERFSAETREVAEALKAKEDAAKQARIETDTLTSEERAALEATAKLTGRVDLLTSAYGRMALAAWEAARAARAASLAEAQTKLAQASTNVQVAEARAQRRARGPGYYGTADGRQPPPPGLDAVVRNTAAQDPEVVRSRREARIWADAVESRQADLAQVFIDGRAPGGVERYSPRITGGGGGNDRSRGGGGGGQSEAARAQEQYADELDSLREQLVQVRYDERQLAAVRALSAAGLDTNINAEDERSKAIIAASNALYDAQKAVEDETKAKELSLDATRAAADAALELQAAVGGAAGAYEAELQSITDSANARIAEVRALNIEEDERNRIIGTITRETEARRAAARERRRLEVEDLRTQTRRGAEDSRNGLLSVSDRSAADYLAEQTDILRRAEDQVAYIRATLREGTADYIAAMADVSEATRNELERLAKSNELNALRNAFADVKNSLSTLFRGSDEDRIAFFADLALQFGQAIFLAKTLGITMQEAFAQFGGGGASGGLVGSIMGLLQAKGGDMAAQNAQAATQAAQLTAAGTTVATGITAAGTTAGTAITGAGAALSTAIGASGVAPATAIATASTAMAAAILSAGTTVAASIAAASAGGGGGGPAGTIATAIAGFRSAGGPVFAGRTYVVGENGPELFRAPGNGSITGNASLSGGNYSINGGPINITINGKADERKLSAAVQKAQQRALEQQIKKVQNYHKGRK